MFEINKLKVAEQQIENLLNQNEANWKDVAKIALAVREKELFKQSEIKSFTAWVNAVAKKCDRQPSLIWRYIKAAKYYLHTIDSDDVEQIDNAVAAPEALINLEKVERNAPLPVFEKLKEKVLAGEATVKETRAIEQEYRPENSESRRGRPSKEEEGKYKHLGKLKKDTEEENISETAKIIEIAGFQRNQIATTISRSLKTNLVDWTKSCSGMRYPPKHYKEHTEVRVNFERKRLRLDFMAVVRWSYGKPKDIFGVEIKSSLSDLMSDRKWEHYLNFCHYFCFAILGGDLELRKAIEDNTDTEVGILEINFNSKITDDIGYKVNVYRQPKRLKPDLVSLVYETLYERVVGWSSSENQINEPKVPRNPARCNPVKGDRVFSVQYAFDRWQQPEWHTVGATDKNDAIKYIKELKITTNGEKPNIVKVVELLYNSKTRMWE
ncbi:MAG: MmcB family DNA repair protein [Waterburya sp.]